MVSMAQSVDLSIATVIEHVGKNCVSQTKSLLCRVRFPGRWKITTSGMLENDPSRPLAPNCNHFSIFSRGTLTYFSVYLKRAPRILEEIGAIFIMFSGMLIPLVKFCKSFTKKSSSQPWNCDFGFTIAIFDFRMSDARTNVILDGWT